MESNIFDHKFIVIDGGHFNPLGIVRSLGEKGIRSDVIAIDSPDAIMAQSKYVNSKVFVKSAEEGVEYILNHYANEKEKPFIFTGSDSVISVIDRNFDKLKDVFFVFNCGIQNGINHLLSKYEQNVLARSVGLNVPDFEEVKVGELPKHVKYPILTKAATSLEYDWKSLTHICRNEKELIAAYSTMNCETVLLQSYIEKENETGFDALCINSGADTYLPLQLTYHEVSETSFGHSIYFFTPEDKELIKKVEKLMSLTKYEGILSVDLLIGKDQKVYFLEVNFRNTQWSYPSTCAGVNLPYIWAKSMLTGKLEIEDVVIKKEKFTSIIELYELTYARKKGVRNLIRTLKKVLQSDSYIIFNWKDMSPFFWSIKKFILNYIK